MPKCLKITGHGTSHPCVKSTQKSVVGITNVIQKLKPQVQDQVCYSLLKLKLDRNSNLLSKCIKLNTSGTPVKIEMNPSTSLNRPSICTETLDNIRIQAGLSLNQMKIVEGGIRADLGHHAIPPHYREHASSQIHILDNFFNVGKQNFITETKNGVLSIYTDLWTVCVPIFPLIEWINNYRNNTASSDYLIIYVQ